MAGFNEILVGRFNRSMQKLFGIKGTPPVPTLSSELMPMIEAENLPAELRYLAGWGLWGFAVNVAGSAGNTSALRLRNPVKSGVIATIELITYSPTIVPQHMQLNQQFTSVDLLTPGIAVSRDHRINPTSTASSTIVPSFGNPAATAGNLLWLGQLTNQLFQLIDSDKLVIVPGDSYTMWSVDLNSAASFSIWWRERPIEEGETI